MADSGLQPAILFLILFPFLVSSLVIGIRVWKKRQDRKLALEDYLLVVAQVLTLAFTTTTWILVKKAYIGYRPWNVPNDAVNPEKTRKLRFINAMLYRPIVSLIKISFLITLIKLRSMNRYINICLWAILGLVCMTVLSGPLTVIFECWPMEAHWDPSAGHCVDKRKTIVTNAAITLLTDVLVLLMPTWILHDLQMERRLKIQVIAFLSLGLAVVAISTYRLVMFTEVFSVNNGTTESTYSIRTVLSNLECNLAAIAACGPTIKWLLGTFIPFFRTDITDTRSSRSWCTGGQSFVFEINRRTARRGVVTINEVSFEQMSRSDEALEMKFNRDASHQDNAFSERYPRPHYGGKQESIGRGITKTTQWTVENTESGKSVKSDVNFQASPRDMV